MTNETQKIKELQKFKRNAKFTIENKNAKIKELRKAITCYKVALGSLALLTSTVLVLYVYSEIGG